MNGFSDPLDEKDDNSSQNKNGIDALDNRVRIYGCFKQ